MKKILITIGSMDIGGIERSLIGLLNSFDYEKYNVDLLLFSMQGEFLPLVPPQCRILPEIPRLATLFKPVKEVLFSGHAVLAAARVYSKIQIKNSFKLLPEDQKKETSYSLLQAYWDNSIRLIPELKTEYDAALSFMWPHHFVAEKVNAKKKIAWVHTDFTKTVLNYTADKKIWNMFDKIAVVSEECGEAFLNVYPSLREKIVTIENILSAEFIRSRADEFLPDEMRQSEFLKLLSVGRFCYAKAFDFAADVCRLLIDKGTDVKWFLIGYGSDEELIRQKIKALELEKNFIILGKKINPYPYMKACDIYVQPSRYEGKAVTVREAQVLGKPVVITDFQTAKSQVKNGFDAIISPMDAESLADIIVRLYHDEPVRQSLSKNTFASDYSNSDQIDRIYRLIEGKELQ